MLLNFKRLFLPSGVLNTSIFSHIYEESIPKVLVIAYFFMVLFWPHTHQNIFLLPFKLAMEAFSFGFGVPFVLFNGEIFQPHE